MLLGEVLFLQIRLTTVRFLRSSIPARPPPLFPNPFILHSLKGLTRIQPIPLLPPNLPPLLFSSSPNSGRFFSLTASRARHSSERGKAGPHISFFFLPSAMSHHYFLFRATTFDSSRQNYFFE